MGRMYRIRHLRITLNEKDSLYSDAEKAQGKKWTFEVIKGILQLDSFSVLKHGSFLVKTQLECSALQSITTCAIITL